MNNQREIHIKTCNRCGYTWVARTEDPVTCGNPKCRSPYWSRASDNRRLSRVTPVNAAS